DGVPERLLRVDAVGASLEPQERGDRLEVVLDTMVDLLGERAAERHPPVLEGDRGLVRDRVEQLAVVVGERRVTVDDELADPAAPPAEREPDRVGAPPALRPGDPPVLEHDRGTRRMERLDRRRDDRLQRLLEVEDPKSTRLHSTHYF